MTRQLEAISAAAAYFHSVPNLHYPRNLINHHPHIAAEIYKAIHSPHALNKVFDTLLLHHEADRLGLSHQEVLEVIKLKSRLLGDTSARPDWKYG